MTTVRQLALLTALSAVVYFTGLGVPRLWDRDEPRNAEASRRMHQTGDWVVPRFNGELRTHKPVLINWFMASGFAVFDDPEFAARFWSAALGVGTVLMTYAIGRRLFNPAVGAWGGVILSTNLLFTFMARLATPEMPFTFFLTAATLVYVMGAFKRGDAPASASENSPAPIGPEPYFPRSWLLIALMYAVMGVAVLAKGPAGIVLPTAVIGMFLLIMRLPHAGAHLSERTDGSPAAPSPTISTISNRPLARAGWWKTAVATALRPFGPRHPLAVFLVGMAIEVATALRPFGPRHFLRTVWLMRPITALLVAGAVALPWYVLVWRATDGAWVKGFIFEHNVGRAATPMEGHGGGLLLYPLMVLFFYPASILVGFFPWSVLSVAAGIETTRQIRRRDPWRPGYVFLACWAGVYVVAFSIARTKLASYMTPIYPALSLLTAAFVYRWVRGTSAVAAKSVTDALRTQAVIGGALVIGLPVASWFLLRGELWVGAVGLAPLIGALVALRYVKRERLSSAAIALAATAIVAALAFTLVVIRIDRYQHSGPLLAIVRAHSHGATPRLATFSRHEPSWVFYSGQQLEDYRRPRDAAAFLGSGPDAFVITSDDKLPALQKLLPPGVEVLGTTPYFGKSGDLMVLGHRTREK